MKTLLDNQTEHQIDQSINLLKDILGKDLLGAYLYGSSIVGGLQKYSDIDLFVVSNRQTTPDDKTQLVKKLLTLSGADQNTPLRPIEMTIVVKSEINPWHYLPNFDFQYGEWMRTEFENGNIDPWSIKVMPDLAVLITQVLLASETLLGATPNQLLATVPYKDFIEATSKERDNLMVDLNDDTRNVPLTYARIWSTVETNKIRSKSDAAAWILDRLPQEYKHVMQRARAICLGEENEHWEDLRNLIRPCAEFMVNKIKEQVSLIKSSNDLNKSIKLA